jgi:hypothetical protein
MGSRARHAFIIALGAAAAVATGVRHTTIEHVDIFGAIVVATDDVTIRNVSITSHVPHAIRIPDGATRTGIPDSQIGSPAESPTEQAGVPASSGDTPTEPTTESAAPTAERTVESVAPEAPPPSQGFPPPLDGFPSPANTGPRTAPTEEVESFDSSANGEVIEGLTINGRLTIEHDDVIVRDVIVMGTETYMIRIREKADGECPSNVLIEYTEVNGENAPPNAIAVYGGDCGYTFDHGYVHNTGRGIRLVNDVTVTNSYVHVARTYSGAHRTAIGHNGGHNLRVVHNTLFCELDGCSSALSMYGDFAPVEDVLIQHNLLATSGHYCIYGGSFENNPYPEASNIRILDNHFSTSLAENCGISAMIVGFDDGIRGNEYRGNVWHENGQPANL